MAGIDQDSMPFGKMDPNTSYANRSMRRDKSFATDRDVSLLARDASFALAAGKDTGNYRSQRKALFENGDDYSLPGHRYNGQSVQPGHLLNEEDFPVSDNSMQNGWRKPHAVPQNYQNDPTLSAADYNDSFDSVKAAKSEADELYQKVLRETKGALVSNPALRGDLGEDELSFLIQHQMKLSKTGSRKNNQASDKQDVTPDPVRELADPSGGVSDDQSQHSAALSSRSRMQKSSSSQKRQQEPHSEASSTHLASRGSSSIRSHSQPSVRHVDAAPSKQQQQSVNTAAKRPPKEPELVSSDNFMKSQMSSHTMSTVQPHDSLEQSTNGVHSPDRSADVAASNSIAHSVASDGLHYTDSFEGSEDTGSPRLLSQQSSAAAIVESEEDF